MTGLDLLVLATAGAAAVLLIAAGVGHLRHRRLFAATLDAQRVLPVAVRPVVALLMGPVELFLGILVALAPLTPATPLLVLAGAAGLLYLALAGYVAVVWRTRPRVPCGCFGSQAPASAWTVGRALVLGLACLAVAFTGIGPGDGTQAAVVGAASLVLAGVFWALPEIG